MQKKSNYFRHSFSSHKDSKVRELIERGKGKAHSVYMILLELYGASYFNDDTSNITQKITLKQIANACCLSQKTCWDCIQLISDCKLIEAFKFESKITYIEIRVSMEG